MANDERARYLELKERQRLEELRARNSEGAGENAIFNAQEQHPAISFEERLKAKNFASNPAAYIKQLHPEADVKVKDGEVFMKLPGEAEYKTLDPKGWGLKEIAQDIADIAYDIPAGVVQGAGSAIGAAPGVLTANPLLMAGGMVGGGAIAGASTEALKQALGKALGIENNMKAGDIATVGALSGVLPMMGAGASMAGKAVMQPVKNAGNWVKEGAKSYARSAARFSKEMADTYLNERPKVEVWRNLISSPGSLATQEKAIDVLNKNKKALLDAGLDKYEEKIMKIIAGEKINIPEEDIKALADMGFPEVGAIFKQAKKNQYALEQKLIVPADDAQRMKQIAQKAANYKGITSNELASGVASQAKQEQAGDIATKLKLLLEEINPDVRKTNQDLAMGKELQQEIAQGQRNPIEFLKSAREDTMARMERVANLTNNPDLVIENRALRTAKAMNPVDIDDALSRKIERKLGRGALQAINYLENRKPYIPNSSVLPSFGQVVPKNRQLWIDMMNEIYKQNEEQK